MEQLSIGFSRIDGLKWAPAWYKWTTFWIITFIVIKKHNRQYWNEFLFHFWISGIDCIINGTFLEENTLPIVQLLVQWKSHYILNRIFSVFGGSTKLCAGAVIGRLKSFSCIYRSCTFFWQRTVVCQLLANKGLQPIFFLPVFNVWLSYKELDLLITFEP